MKRIHLTIVLIAVLLSSLSLSCGGETVDEETVTGASGLPSQSSTSGEVEVRVTPVEVGPESENWYFKVELTTHTVELDEDLLAAAVLTDDAGNEFKPGAYDGDPPGGHHRSGTLKFDMISPYPKSVSLKLRGVGGIGERSFSWMLNAP